MLIRVGFSADPDDAFMFWGLASGTVDARGYEFEPVIDDIQSLNELALDGQLEVTAMSAATYPLVQDRYLLLPHGGSIGSGYGPIVVAREPLSLDELRATEIVIPGKLTTAFLVLKLALGDDIAYRVLPFDEIQPEVAAGRATAGLLIHEGQLTYAENGLKKIVDLGEWWAARTGGLPLPGTGTDSVWRPGPGPGGGGVSAVPVAQAAVGTVARSRLRRSASASSRQLPNRSCGALASARASTAPAAAGRSGRRLCSRGGGSDMCA